MQETKRERTPAIIDCNVWIDLLSGNDALEKKIVEEGYPIIITSYGVVEVLRALGHIARKLKIPPGNLESKFWSFCILPSIDKQFKVPFTTSLIDEVKNTPEFRVIAKLLDMEVKDTPYIVAAFQHGACLVTQDKRSILVKKEEIKQKLGVRALTDVEFLSEK